MALDMKQGLIAAIACIIAAAGFIGLSINASSSYTRPVSTVTVQDVKTQLLSPAGGNIILTIYASVEDLPIAHISVTYDSYAIFGYKVVNLEFPYVTQVHPLVPGGSISQVLSWQHAPVSTIVVSGVLVDGSKFSSEIDVTQIK